MADTRILHRAAGTGKRVNLLTDFEYRVWTQYLLSADDYGVMEAEANVLQADNLAIRNKPIRQVEAAIAALVRVGLVSTFNVEGRRFIWQLDWQTRQKLRHPRLTLLPCPPASELVKADAPTLKFFSMRPEGLPKDFGKDAAEFQTPARAGTRETQTHTQTLPPAPEGGVGETAPPVRHAHPRQQFGGSIIQSQKAHLSHAICLPTVPCVPGFILDEQLKAIGGEANTREDRLRAFYLAVDRAHDGSTIGHAAPEFWRKEFKAKFAPAESPSTSRRGAIVSTEIDPGKYGRVTISDDENDHVEEGHRP